MHSPATSMEAPRSRKLVALSPTTHHAPNTNGDNSCCSERSVVATSANPILPRAFLDAETDVILVSNDADEPKKSVRRVFGAGGHGSSSSGMSIVWILFLAVGLMLLFTVLLSLKVHLKTHRAGIESGSGSMDVDVEGARGHDFVSDVKKQHHMRTFEEQRQQQLLQFQSRGLSVTKSAVLPAVSARVPPAMPTASTESEGSTTSTVQADHTLNGLLADIRDYGSDHICISRAQTTQKPIKYIPSEFLTKKLREYESLHRKCAAYADSFSYTVAPGMNSFTEKCRFIVWTASSGMGNRLLSIVSAFLYALLTNRMLLVDSSSDVSKLFCEPFPGTSWLLPPEFPASWLQGLNETSQVRFGEQYKKRVEFPSPAFSYVHLTHTSDDDDNRFFCEQGQDYLRSIPWIFMKANNYIVPGLFFVSSFRPQLEQLFPEKESLFHLLGRYLFQPSNAVWPRISRFQKTYMAANDEQVGIQIRTFNDTHILYHFEEQLLQCALRNEILPKVEGKDGRTSEEAAAGNFARREGKDASKDGSTLTVLVTSLQSAYSERLKDLYLSAPTEDGHVVAVHQASVEGWQRDDSFNHDVKAWADIFLLSYSDALMTSGWSTFGYAAQGLAGVKPWILFRSTDYTIPDPPCTYARSVEPCFHQPPLIGCDSGLYKDPSKILPYVQTCEDVAWGIKLIDPTNAMKQ